MDTAEIRTPGVDDLDAVFRRDEEAFGGAFTDEQRRTWSDLLDLSRFRLAVDGTSVVGLAGSHALELTLPGDTVVPMAGTTWVSVAPTHRRRGLLRRLIDEVHADIDARGEPIAGLMASEAGIYERFGYGVATRWRHVEIDRRRTRFDDRFLPDVGGMEMIDPLAEVDRLADIYDRYRRRRVGEVSRTAPWIRMRLTEEPGRRGGVIHADGYAAWTIKEDWNDFDPRHELRLDDVVACTDEARAAVWNLILSHDLVGPIRSTASIAIDDPLPAWLTNPRAVRTTALHDFLWLCPRQVAELCSARRYRVDDSMVVEVEGERWRIEGGAEDAHAEMVDDAPDVTMTRGALGSLLLGGVTATELASTKRLTGDDLPRADVFFGWSPAPHCTTSF